MTLRTPACSSFGGQWAGLPGKVFFSLGRLGLPPRRWDSQAHVRWGTGEPKAVLRSLEVAEWLVSEGRP